MGVHYVRGTPNKNRLREWSFFRKEGSPYRANCLYCHRCRLWFLKKEAWHENRCPACHQIMRSTGRSKKKTRRGRPKKIRSND